MILKTRYFRLICTKITIVYRPIFMLFGKSSSNLVYNHIQVSGIFYFFVPTSLWYIRISTYILKIKKTIHQTYAIMMPKNQVFWLMFTKITQVYLPIFAIAGPSPPLLKLLWLGPGSHTPKTLLIPASPLHWLLRIWPDPLAHPSPQNLKQEQRG